MRPLVTALVDTYNHERFIEQALTSVLEQGLSAEELEIVVVDDGSTDKTPEIIKKFVPHVKLVRKKNGGQASALNTGFAETHGEIVTLLDGDDWWAKGKLAAVTNALERNPEVAAVGHGYYEFDEEKGETRVRVPPAETIVTLATPFAAQVSWPFLLMGALTVRRSLLEWMMPIPEELVFMADSAIQVAAMTRGALLLEQPLFYYRRHAQNLWVIDENNAAKLRRRCEMTELMFTRTSQMLINLGLSEASVAGLLSGPWAEAKQLRLSRFGGTRLETFQTEMELFRAAFTKPSAGYRFFKYAIVGASALLLPPRRFYEIRDWYAKKQLGRYRDRLFKEERV
jgi:glycosyltransferase involved in cell wall biosynthesis